MEREFDIESYLEEATRHAQAQTRAHDETWNIGSAERWNTDPDTGLLTWTFPDGHTASAPLQFVGTWNEVDDTFLWAWDHPSIPEHLGKDARAVLEFAKANDIEFLQRRLMPCSELEAWQMAALTAMVCHRQGTYRGSHRPSFFMTFGEVEISKNN